MINNIYNKHLNYTFNNSKVISSNFNPQFRGNISIPNKKIFEVSENILSSLAIIKRFMHNKFLNKGKSQQLEKFYYNLLSIDYNSSRYIKILHNYARKYAKNREVEINLESRRLLDIVNSDEACIFIMSHDDGKKDVPMLGVLYTLLTGAYINSGKGDRCPRPKIIVNEDILSAMNGTLRSVYKLLGAVGINAKLFSMGKRKNANVMRNLIDEFNKDKSHIFVFPEGKMGMFQDLDLKDKFQAGVGGIVNKAAQNKKHVKVVPVGFAYNYETKNFLGSIYIGEPVYFMAQDKQMLVNRANIDLEHASLGYKKFFCLENENYDSFKTITTSGVPVTGRELGNYIAGILCENLRICKAKAQQQLPKIPLNDKSIKI